MMNGSLIFGPGNQDPSPKNTKNRALEHLEKHSFHPLLYIFLFQPTMRMKKRYSRYPEQKTKLKNTSTTTKTNLVDLLGNTLEFVLLGTLLVNTLDLVHLLLEESSNRC